MIVDAPSEWNCLWPIKRSDCFLVLAPPPYGSTLLYRDTGRQFGVELAYSFF